MRAEHPDVVGVIRRRGAKKPSGSTRPAVPPAVPPAKPRSTPLPPGCQTWGDAFAPARPVPGGVARRNVRATYHYYSPAYDTASLACADRFWADPGHSRKLLKYPWTAYCLKDRTGPPDASSACGKCLRITNTRTGSSVVARAVDKGGCSDADGTGLDLDPCAFDAIDLDRRGYADGFMRVDVREVECGTDATF